MNTVSVPILPTGLWLLASAGTIAILLVLFFQYVYLRRRFSSAQADFRDLAQLAARKEQLQADEQEIRNWIIGQKDELARFQSEREEQERIRGELSRLQSECATFEQRNMDLRKEAGEFETQRHSKSQAIDRLEKEAVEIQRRIEELRNKQEELLGIEGRINAAQATLDKANEQLIATRQERENIARTVADKRIELDALHRECDGLDKSREVFEEDAKKAKAEAESCGRDAEEARQQLNEIAQQLQSKMGELLQAESRLHELERGVRRLESETERVEQNLTELNKRKQDADQVMLEAEGKARRCVEEVGEAGKLLEQIKRQLQEKKERIEELKKKELTLTSEVAALQRERDKLASEIGGIDGRKGEADPNDAYADLLHEPPPCLKTTTVSNRTFPYLDEERALMEVQNQLENAGYHFHERVVKAFHTALKCHDINPLTVLAGVSGTGKTLLPTAYARLMGMHSLIIAVQPRWDSPQDMFGFYNYLEKKYKATDLARALIRMDPFNTVELPDKQRCADRMLLVLLDEMNLARTEYYFSEFLSKLELRRLAGSAHAADRQHAEILLDTGPGRKQITFWVGRNVLFAGTMNEDETTQTLSDKVLDRANVLRFGRPPKMKMEAQQHQDKTLPEAMGYMTMAQWEKWCQPIQASPWNGQIHNWIDALNDALTKVGRPFGHRIRKSILTYVSNYPGVNSDQGYKDAFADQIEQKILPKLRGLDTMEGINNAAFDDLSKIIDATGDEILRKTFSEARENNATGLFLWQGVTRDGR